MPRLLFEKIKCQQHPVNDQQQKESQSISLSSYLLNVYGLLMASIFKVIFVGVSLRLPMISFVGNFRSY